MKKTNVCPKCGGTDIVKVPGTASGSGRYCYNEVRPIHGRGSGRPLRCTCGYSEEWLRKSNLDDIKERWAKKPK